jgi:hypothetical protein
LDKLKAFFRGLMKVHLALARPCILSLSHRKKLLICPNNFFNNPDLMLKISKVQSRLFVLQKGDFGNKK